MLDVLSIKSKSRKTSCLAVNIFDMFMQKTKKTILLTEIQAVAIASLVLATKMEEVKSITIEKAIEYTNYAYTKQQVKICINLSRFYIKNLPTIRS